LAPAAVTPSSVPTNIRVVSTETINREELR
jgi:hypothetical protein